MYKSVISALLHIRITWGAFEIRQCPFPPRNSDLSGLEWVRALVLLEVPL